MGFGTLFIGYFFILNISYYGFTDAVAGIIMLYAAYKLAEINRGFKLGAWATAFFTVFGIFELGYNVYDIFFVMGSVSPMLISAISLLRYVLVALATAFLLFGMREVANEVGLRILSIKCERVLYMSIPVYGISILLEILAVLGISGKIFTVIGIMTLVCNVALTVMVLICIYSCYAKICMPGDEERETKTRESRFAFVNAFRRHEEEKQREYAEYKLAKYKKAQEKKQRKSK